MSSDPGAELLRGVLEAPDEDPPRLVYADWLMEQGDPRGEFISVQVQLRQRISPARRARAKARERELVAEHGKTFAAPAKECKGRPRFRRGFIDEITTNAAAFVKHGEALMAIEPIRHLGLSRVNTKTIEKLLAANLIGRLASLNCFRELKPKAVRALAESEQLQSLRRLNLGGTGLGDEGLGALASSPYLRCTSLCIYDNEITDAGVEALVGWPQLSACTHLYLSRNQITDAGAQLLAGARLDSMQMLSLGGNEEITDEGALAFADERLAEQLHRVELDYIDVSSETAERLREIWGDGIRIDG